MMRPIKNLQSWLAKTWCSCAGLQATFRMIVHGGLPRGVLAEALVDPENNIIREAVQYWKADVPGVARSFETHHVDWHSGLDRLISWSSSARDWHEGIRALCAVFIRAVLLHALLTIH
jgi:hypothetical protein